MDQAQYNKIKSKFKRFSRDEDILTDCVANKIIEPHRANYHHFVDALRSHHKRVTVDGQKEIFFNILYDPIESPLANPGIQFANQELRLQIKFLFRKVLSRRMILNRKMSVRRVFFRRFVLQHTPTEIAQVCGITPSAVSQSIIAEIKRIKTVYPSLTNGIF